MQNIDTLLPDDDGLKWFNLLYLFVTRQVRDNPPANGFADVAWLTRLDVVFANTLGTGKIPGRGQGYFVQPCEWKHEG